MILNLFKYSLVLLIICIFAHNNCVHSASLQYEKRQFQNLLQSLLGGGDEAKSTSPEPDWNNSGFKELVLETEEKMIKPSDLYAKITECVRKCIDEKIVNPNRSLRDNCIAKNCDVY